MKSNRNRRFLINLALVAVAVCFSTVGGNAQDVYKGKFTLPFEARWGPAVLPAGDYTFTIPSLASPYVIYVRGEEKSAIVIAATADSRVVTSDHTQLNFANIGDEHLIRTFEVPQLGLVFVYGVPAAKRNQADRAHAPMRDVSTPATGAFQSPQAGALLGSAVGNLGEVDVAGRASAILATVNRPRIAQFALKFNF